MAPRIAGIAVVVASFVWVSDGASQEESLFGSQDQSPLYKSLRDVINTGADLFNLQGDYAGCYRLYQGSLLSIKPFLQVGMQRDIDKALAEADKKANFADRAHHLRKAIDAIRAQIKPSIETAPWPKLVPLPPPILKKSVKKMALDGELIRVPPKKSARISVSGEPTASADSITRRQVARSRKLLPS